MATGKEIANDHGPGESRVLPVGFQKWYKPVTCADVPLRSPEMIGSGVTATAPRCTGSRKPSGRQQAARYTRSSTAKISSGASAPATRMGPTRVLSAG
jgi:hypothetical protein